jgi:hypothetical protein
VLERQLPRQVVFEEIRNVLPTHSAVVDAVRKRDEISGEAVTADVRALPRRRLVQLLADRVPERTAVPSAAAVVLAVGAGEEQLVVDGLRALEGIEVPKIFVVRQVDSREALLPLSRVGDVDGDALVVAPVGPPDEQKAGSGPRSDKLAEPLFHLVRETASGERVVAPKASILDEEPMVDPAGRSAEGLLVFA